MKLGLALPYGGVAMPFHRGFCKAVVSDRRPLSTLASVLLARLGYNQVFKRGLCLSRRSHSDKIVHITDRADPRIALYLRRDQRDCSVYDRQVRALAEAALKSQGFKSAMQEEASSAKEKLKPLSKLDCVVDVHYSQTCFEQLHQALVAGQKVYVDSVMLAHGDESMEMALEVAPVVYLLPPDLVGEFRQDVPWSLEDAPQGTAGRLFRRFEGCRFLVAFPCSSPLAQMKPPFVILDGLNSASNVGQVLRTAYHLGITSVVAAPGAWSCLNGRASRVSMGWFYRMSPSDLRTRLPYLDVDVTSSVCFHAARPLAAAIQELKELGVCIYGAENQFSDPVAPHEPRGDHRWALVVGSEFKGVSQEILEMCDKKICVPQQQGQSLNVAHACSICLYELSKHNVMGKTHVIGHDN
ncbi:unnamed protein product [Effrenium voratum]|nr:unnamed protein product [Effrenium voratum]